SAAWNCGVIRTPIRPGPAAGPACCRSRRSRKNSPICGRAAQGIFGADGRRRTLLIFSSRNSREVMMMNRQWILTRRPRGMVVREDFERRETPVPSRKLDEGEVLLRYRVFLCAPTIRNWMDANTNSFYRTIELGQPVM